MVVPITTAIRRSRVSNIDSSRLARRHQHLLHTLFTEQGSSFMGRIPMAQRAAELMVIERELIARGLVSENQILMMRNHASGLSAE